MSSASSTPATADTQRRRKRWSAIAAEKKRTDTGGSDTSETYLQLLVRASQDDADGLIQRQIDKDVRRVPIPVEEPAVLGRVLTAFAARNAEGGYCQGLNFIVSLLLVAVPEEDAFWLLCLLVEDILPPGFYSTELHGSKAEVSVLTQLVARYLPTINPLLARWSLTLEPFVFAWIMCLFVGELPLHLVLDVWDRLLVDGATVLCRASLSLLRIHEPALSAAQSIDDAMLAMQSHRAWVRARAPPRRRLCARSSAALTAAAAVTCAPRGRHARACARVRGRGRRRAPSPARRRCPPRSAPCPARTSPGARARRRRRSTGRR